MKRIILLHFLIMLKSIPCLAQRPLLKAELIRYCTPPSWIYTKCYISLVKKMGHMSVLLIASRAW